MPARKDIHSILIIGSGPIMIGQACEFDYSGCQAVQVLRAEGYRTILVNPNPATMMTTPGLADRLYMDPIENEYLEAIIATERPDALLATMGGQTALNAALSLSEAGILSRYGVELIGASVKSIHVAEDRGEFQKLMDSIGLDSPHSRLVRSFAEAELFAQECGYPLIIRPSFTLGGSGGATVENSHQLAPAIEEALIESPQASALVEESLAGWGEFEFEVMRDRYDNAVIVCAIENIDGMGVHTGDSITVAPTQSLSDREYQRMRDASLAILRAVGVDCGGSNVQFAFNHASGDMRVIEMNPRVSRSSALASKATGYPIARCAARLAVGYSLAEIDNEITKKGSACFEPSIDYIAVKAPRFAEEKFGSATTILNTSMKAIGESLAMGRNFIDALNKALRGIEINASGLELLDHSDEELHTMLTTYHPKRIFALFTLLFRAGAHVDEATIDNLRVASEYHRWFVEQLAVYTRFLHVLRRTYQSDHHALIEAARYGMSAQQLAHIVDRPLDDIEALYEPIAHPMSYHMVDTCAGEFNALSPYYYSAPNEVNEATPLDGNKVIIIGSGPNRIGQGLEFDTCCTLASIALRNNGMKTIMINCNPETVSTDHNFSDRLYLEPVERESVLNIMRNEKCNRIIVQLGGQTAINMASYLAARGAEIVGTPVEQIHRAEERGSFAKMIADLGIGIPKNCAVHSVDEARRAVKNIGYPALIRPSYVLGGTKMATIFNNAELDRYLNTVNVSEDSPLQIDQFLEDAFEYDVDLIADGEAVYIAGIMEHIEAAGIHSGDSACIFPAYKYSSEALDTMRQAAVMLATQLQVVGFLNLQFAVKDNAVYIIEVNPRVSRTVPFISKVTGVNLIDAAARVWLGTSLHAQRLVDNDGYGEGRPIAPWAVKEAHFSFGRFSNFDPLLGPEMRSTGESIGIGQTFGAAFSKAVAATGAMLPKSGNVAISVHDSDKQSIVPIARALLAMGFALYATRGTAAYLARHSLNAHALLKPSEGTPNILDYIRDDRLNFIINTPLGSSDQLDDSAIRIAAIRHHIPFTTTISAAEAAVEGIAYRRLNTPDIYSFPDVPLFRADVL